MSLAVDDTEIPGHFGPIAWKLSVSSTRYKTRMRNADVNVMTDVTAVADIH